jgi:dGTPase
VTWTAADREARQFNVSSDDQRVRFARDRDRILYSSAFHRLAGITQIVRAGELDIFHTRQQHTYKVAQVGRRLAENLLRNHGQSLGALGVDPEVVEAACMAHDLGHPPFGHAAEKALDELVLAAGDDDGFEGNAQTFRILTKLAVRFGVDECLGLDLTRATLAATLKYPWLRDRSDAKKRGKWSAYKSERQSFEWARKFHPHDRKTAEAEIMDWADDIAYSVHDLEDFHRVGVIPWDQIFAAANRPALVQAVLNEWFDAPSDAERRVAGAIDRLEDVLQLFPAVRLEIYDGHREQRRQLRNLTSVFIGKYIRALGIASGEEGPLLAISLDSADEVRVLKHIARRYVIGLPALHAQQIGQRRIISELFETFLSAAQKAPPAFVPMRLRHIWDIRGVTPPRIAADCISSLTENEAYQLHRRITGEDSGSILDPVVR